MNKLSASYASYDKGIIDDVKNFTMNLKLGTITIVAEINSVEKDFNFFLSEVEEIVINNHVYYERD